MTTAVSLSNETKAIPNRALAAERMGRIVAVTGAHAIILLDATDGFFEENVKGAEIGTK